MMLGAERYWAILLLDTFKDLWGLGFRVSTYILTNGLDCTKAKNSHAACFWRISGSEDLEESRSTYACKERIKLSATYVCT